MRKISSANPEKLANAAVTVPQDVAAELATAGARLEELFVAFTGRAQSPERVWVSPASHVDDLAAALRDGSGLDDWLAWLAAAFRVAGRGGRVDAVSRPLYVGDDKIAALMVRDVTEGQPWFRRYRGSNLQLLRLGSHEMRGPGDQWYTVIPSPPMGAVRLGWREGIFDLGFPEGIKNMVGAGILGFGGPGSRAVSRPAPPAAYEELRWNDGELDVEDVANKSRRLRKLPVEPTTDPELPRSAPAAGWGVDLGIGAGREVALHKDDRHRNIFRMEASYYVDDAGQRVAVVDAARISYSNENNDATVQRGQLGFDVDGNPVVTPPSYPRPDPGDPLCPPAPEEWPPPDIVVKANEEAFDEAEAQR